MASIVGKYDIRAKLRDLLGRECFCVHCSVDCGLGFLLLEPVLEVGGRRR